MIPEEPEYYCFNPECGKYSTGEEAIHDQDDEFGVLLCPTCKWELDLNPGTRSKSFPEPSITSGKRRRPIGGTDPSE